MILFLMQASSVARNKQIYILKKTVVPINAENYRELLLFGLLSASPVLQLSSTIEQVTVIPSILHQSHNKAFCSMYCQLCFVMQISSLSL